MAVQIRIDRNPTGQRHDMPIAARRRARAGAWKRLFVLAGQFAGFRIDQVQTAAGRTRDGDESFIVRRIVRDHALHNEARCRTAIKEGRHFEATFP